MQTDTLAPPALASRERATIRARTHLAAGRVPLPLDNGSWAVPSSDGDLSHRYRVSFTPEGAWQCDCPAAQFPERGVVCWHGVCVELVIFGTDDE